MAVVAASTPASTVKAMARISISTFTSDTQSRTGSGMSARARADFAARLRAAGRAVRHNDGQRRAFDFSFRNSATGKFNSGLPVPSPRAMQNAYPRGSATLLPRLPNEINPRTIAAAAGTEAVKSHPVLGPVAKTETASIAETIKRFLVSRATKAAIRA